MLTLHIRFHHTEKILVFHGDACLFNLAPGQLVWIKTGITFAT